jgi:hypothetical protein
MKPFLIFAAFVSSSWAWAIYKIVDIHYNNSAEKAQTEMYRKAYLKANTTLLHQNEVMKHCICFDSLKSSKNN